MISFKELFRIFGRIGLLSFGGPAAQIALMHRELVEERPWLTEAQFLRALSFCMMLPGPEAMQLATYAGWKQRGIPGGLIAGGLFVLPGAVVIMIMAMIYAHLGDVPLIQSIFLGVKAAVVIIVIQAILKVAKKALKARTDVIIAVLAFVGLFAFNLPFPLIVACAALFGALRAPAAITRVAPNLSAGHTLSVLLIGAILWGTPIAIAYAAGHEFLVTLGLFFSKLAVVTFGGAYAVLAYMTQEVVTQYEWLETAQMMDALGLAETTPGPLILVTQFVGHLAGADHGMMFLAGLLTLWVTFVPCFIWIFAGAPLIDWLETQPRIAGALSAITAAVVGVIANLSLWFAAHVFFGQVGQFSWGPMQIIAPQMASFSAIAAVLAGIAAILLLGLKWPMVRTLLLMAGLGLLAGHFALP